MDSVVTEPRLEGDERFDTARITAAVDALAEKHASREDLFRAAMAQLLKAEMVAARAVAHWSASPNTPRSWTKRCSR